MGGSACCGTDSASLEAEDRWLLCLRLLLLLLGSSLSIDQPSSWFKYIIPSIPGQDFFHLIIFFDLIRSSSYTFLACHLSIS